MNSLWNDEEAKRYGDDPLALRVYTSRLLGQEPSLVLHGGGNTSVKARATNIFGESDELLYVKGSGWDLATIEHQGFAPVKMDVLMKMVKLNSLSNLEMVRVQRTAMTDPSAPNPSVEAIVHAIIPFAYVDHTHADAIVAITNTEKGEQYIREIYGDHVLIVPYVMPGFILAKKIYDMTRNIDWKQYEAIILMNHGVFTFDDDAKTSYERMIHTVSKAEKYLMRRRVNIIGHKSDQTSLTATGKLRNGFSRIQNLIKQKSKKRQNPSSQAIRDHLLKLAGLRHMISGMRGMPVLAKQKTTIQDIQFSNHKNVDQIATRGPLTPDHVIRTKRVPVIINSEIAASIDHFAEDYRRYFKQNTNRGSLACLDQAPRWAVWPGYGTVVFASNISEVTIISDIVDHTIWAIQAAEKFDRWTALSEKDIFDVEYWDLEQAKLNKQGTPPLFQGKIALVTGAASGIGRACVESLACQGAVVVALDINPDVEHLFEQQGILSLVCDVTDEENMQHSIESVIAHFGGLDILISNAGIFPAGELIENVQTETWSKSIDINLSSHQRLLKQCIPYLSLGIDPAVVIIASKNVPAPGPGASAYSVAKAGLTQLARVAALELGPKGIRVNVVHPNQVFDTGIWTPEVLAARAKQYGMSVKEYKTSNLLKTEITSSDVAKLVCTMVSPVFGKITGAQIPIDGGNDRVI